MRGPSSIGSCRTRPTAVGLSVTAVLVLHGSLLAWSGWRHSPTLMEPEHLAAGLSHLHLARFDLVRVNPPLVRTAAALPVALASPVTDWGRYDSYALRRQDLFVGMDFLRANGARTFWLLTLARWACIPFSLVGAYVCFRWASRLYGGPAGLLACTAWCFSPNILGHGALITPDVAAAAMGAAACYTFWLWLRQPGWQRALVAGGVLGLAELTKTTLLVFYPLWPVIWIVYRWSASRHASGRDRCREAGMLLVIVAVSVGVIHFGYTFEGSFQPLAEYRFKSRMFGGDVDAETRRLTGANRFADTWLGCLPVPLPKNYVQGIDRQRWEFERPQRSFLRGRWRMRGWWYYYVYGLAVKIPLGTWGLVLLAALATLFAARDSAPWRDELLVLAPPAALLVLVSSQTGFSHHLRYVLPIFPFAFVWAGKLARLVEVRHGRMACWAGMALSWSVASSLWTYPHSLSYFNEVVGGPTRGHAHLLDSNVGWGQDLFYLKHWLDAHSESRPVHLASYGHVDPRLAGIEFSLPPVGPVSPDCRTNVPPEDLGPQAGLYAIDVNFLHKSHWPMAGNHKHWDYGKTNESYNYAYFLRFEPVAMAGYSIYIYHVTSDEANRVRRDLGLPKLPGPARYFRGAELLACPGRVRRVQLRVPARPQSGD